MTSGFKLGGSIRLTYSAYQTLAVGVLDGTGNLARFAAETTFCINNDFRQQVPPLFQKMAMAFLFLRCIRPFSCLYSQSIVATSGK
jgi:hypothetical protein